MMKHRGAANITLILLALLTLISQSSSKVANAQRSNRVGLVVGFGDGTLISRCVTFHESEISGYEALMLSDLDIVANDGAICRIEGTGCPADDCFCDKSDYWSYWHLIDGAWQYSESGAAAATVHNGDVEGWNWGAEPPPELPFQRICSPLTIHLPLVRSAGG